MTHSAMTHRATLPHASSPHPPGAGLPRLLPAHGVFPVDLDAHLARHGPPPHRATPGSLIGEVEAAGLTGRGGAAFPVSRKLAAVAESGSGAVVIGNGAEGEPASSKDKSLLWISPHLVLDGLQLAAQAVGSRSIGLYVHRNPRLHQRLRAAIADRAAARIDAAVVQLIEAPDRFLAGEESALVSRVSGGHALPRFKPPRPAERGVAGWPTLVHNVETLAHLALIARYGARWFRAAGTGAEPGSMLLTLTLPGSRPDVIEVPLGTALGDLPGLESSQPQAVLVGGYHGAWLPAATAMRVPLANAALRPLGAAVGAGVVAALPADRCGLAETAAVVRYLALESAGQCGPCLHGLPRIAVALAELAAPGPDRGARSSIERWAGLVEGRGACHHPDGTARLVRSALRTFAGEIEQHERGRCTGLPGRPFLPLPADPPLQDSDWK